MIATRLLIFTFTLVTAAAGCRADDARRDGEAEADRQVAELRKQAKWDEQPTGVKQQAVAD